MAASHDGVHYRFRGWELLPAQRRLLIDGSFVDVGARAFDVLQALVERQTRTVSKDELMSVVWAGRVVEENNISVQIAALRRLIGADAITTIPGVGYRLTAPRDSLAPVMPVLPPPSRDVSGDARRPILFGRDQDIAQLLHLVGGQRLVNITGPGGVGKTSVAREVMARYRTEAGRTCHWVDLAKLRPSDALLSYFASEIGVIGTSGDSPKDLLAALGQTSALIVLDNCEHVVTAVVQLLGAALEAAPHVNWLVTSQIPLHLLGEQTYQLQPLAVPHAAATFSDAVRSGAVAMLRARAASTYRPFEITPDNVGMAIGICRELDGLPLAIEMAASRISSLGLAAVCEQLSDRLRLSTRDASAPDRQQTLYRTFEWSYGLLSETEQRVFRRLEPFLGGFTTRMARQIACDDPEADDGPQPWECVEALSVLVERSLVHRAADAAGRYFLFEGARDYARARLKEAGETAWTRQRHAELVALCFASARADQDRMRDADWEAKYVPERHNVRAALAWACETREPDLMARLVAALAQIDSFSRNHSEVVHCGVPLDTLMSATPRWRASACVEFSWAHFLDGDRRIAAQLARQALDDFRSLDDKAGTYLALAQFIRISEARPGGKGDARDAAKLLAEIDDDSIPLRSRLLRGIMGGLQYEGNRTVEQLQTLHELASRSGLDTLAAVCRAHITDQLLIEGRFDDVVEQTLRFQALDEPRPRIRAVLLVNLILALAQLGRIEEAVAPARIVLGTLPGVSYHVVAAFALAAARAGRFDDSAVMSGFCERMRRERDQLADPAEAAAEDEVARTLAGALEAARFAELSRLGSALSLDQVCGLIPGLGAARA